MAKRRTATIINALKSKYGIRGISWFLLSTQLLNSNISDKSLRYKFSIGLYCFFYC